jgi:serine/threonine-protein kinase
VTLLAAGVAVRFGTALPNRPNRGPRGTRVEVVSADLTGQRLGHYLVQSVLGRGGMSIVYRAVDERLDRPVALKVISENLSADQEFRDRFVEEARAASAIDHVNVVPLYDFGSGPMLDADGTQTGDWLYIAMRLVDGTDLAREVAEGPLPQRRVLDLLGQVGEALDMLHERGLVHLDVKPANVLITRNESVGREHVYLADFGLTRRGTSGVRTASGDFLGSPTYASPEHLRGDPVLAASDLYSLTCVLFSCLAGRAPFVGTVKEVVSGHLRGQVPSLSALTGLPSSIDRVIARGMAADPTQRYSSSAELLGSARRAFSSFDPDPVLLKTATPSVVPTAGTATIEGSADADTAAGEPDETDTVARPHDTQIQSDEAVAAAARHRPEPPTQDDQDEPAPVRRPGMGGEQPLLGRSINEPPRSPHHQGDRPNLPMSQLAPQAGGQRGPGGPNRGTPQGGPSQLGGWTPALQPPPGGGTDGRHRAESRRSVWPWVIAAAVLVIAIVVTLIVALGGSSPNPGGPTAPAPTPSSEPVQTSAQRSAPATTSGGPATGVLPTLVNPSQITDISGLSIPPVSP